MHIYKYTCLNCRGRAWALCCASPSRHACSEQDAEGTGPSPSHPACSGATRASLGVGLVVPLRFSACVRLQVYKQKRLSLCFQDCKISFPYD